MFGSFPFQIFHLGRRAGRLVILAQGFFSIKLENGLRRTYQEQAKVVRYIVDT